MEARTYPELVVVKDAEAKTSTPERGLTRKVLAYNDTLFLAEHRMEKGWAGALHRYPHEQIVYVVRGNLRITCQDHEVDIDAGDSFVVRGGVEHAATAIEDSLVIDVFTPCREDYIG